MPTSQANPALLPAVDIPSRAGGMPQSGQPLTGFTGIKTNIPIQKQYLSGAVRRDSATFAPNGGAVLVASTTYSGFIIMPRAGLITGINLVLGTVPTVAAATLTVSANGVSLLAGANFSVLTTLTAGTIISIPLSTVLAVAPTPPGLPYLPLQVSGFPFPILVTYAEGASTVHSTNVLVYVEYEPDDFNG